MIIAFAATTPALLAGAKDTTRRDWSKSTIALATRLFEQRAVVDAWSNNPRVKGAHKVAEIRLIEQPFYQNTQDMKPFEYAREGFQWMDELPEERINQSARRQFGLLPGGLMSTFYQSWKIARLNLTVVRFEVVKILPNETHD